MHHAPTRTDIACRNCGNPAPQSYCGECGQETALHPPSLGEFLHEFVGHYVALEGALWRTLRLLLLRPGRLTREYLEGRRRRYVLPLRLYLSASFVFFLLLKLLPSTADHALGIADPSQHMRPGIVASAPASAAGGEHAGPRMQIERPAYCGGPDQPTCTSFERLANRIAARYGADPEGFAAQLRGHALGLAPYAVFLLLPVFAGLVMAAYRKRGMGYGEHVVFSLHVHAFWFLALVPTMLLPAVVGGWLMWIVPIYGLLAARAVYGGSWGAALARALFVGVFYALILTVVSAALFVSLVVWD